MEYKHKKVALLFSGLILLANGVSAFDISDPYGVDGKVAAPDSYSTLTKEPTIKKGMTLSELANFALHNNPQTRAAWITALSKAQNIGVANAAYMPSISAAGSLDATKQNSKTSDLYTNAKSGQISLSYTIYDFGAREANLQNAKKILDAANASQNAQIQSLFLSVTESYFALFGAKASLEAYIEAEKTARESYEAALAKYKAGTATPSDKLQAMTAYSQAVLNRQKAEGSLKNSYADLANTLGLDANTSLEIAAPYTNIKEMEDLGNIEEMIFEAKKRRPDLAAAAAQIEAARAGVEAAKSDGRPTISLNGSTGYSDTSLGAQTKNSSGTLSINIPIFSGFSTTYKVRAAQMETRLKELEYAKLEKQVALQTYKAYNNLKTQATAVKSSKDLLASADEALKAASGRYKAGVGSILDLLTAQSAYASARQQNIDAVYNWYIMRATLLQSMGRLAFSEIEKIGNGN